MQDVERGIRAEFYIEIDTCNVKVSTFVQMRIRCTGRRNDKYVHVIKLINPEISYA